MTQNIPKIGYIVNRVTPGSIPADIALGIKRYENVDIDVISYLDNKRYKNIDELSKIDIQANSRTDYNGIKTLHEILNKYDIIQVHHHFSGILSRVLSLVKNVKIIARVGNVRNGFSFAKRNLNTLTFPLCDRVVCNSESVYKSLSRLDFKLSSKDNFTIIENGYDPAQIEISLSKECPNLPNSISEQDEILVSSASFMTRQKGLDTLIKSLAQLSDSLIEKIHICLAGDGPERKKLKNLAKSYNLCDSITFLGVIDRHEVHNLMNETDIYVMPSRWEGFSGASLEAMGIGTACIFSDIGPFVIPYEGYALFHEVDNEQRLAAHLRTLVADRRLREDYAEAASKHVRKNYHMEETAREYVSLYESLHLE